MRRSLVQFVRNVSVAVVLLVLATVAQDSPRDAQFTPVVLRDGTPVKLKLLQRLYSKVVVPDDPVNFSVAEAVMSEGRPVIPAGAAAIGRVSNAKPARTLGRGAQLGIEIQYVKVGTRHIPLRGTAVKSGEGKQAETVAIVALVGLSGLIKHGAEIELPEGTLLNAYIDQDVQVSPLVPAANNDKKGVVQ